MARAVIPNVEAVLSNTDLQLTVRPVTALAICVATAFGPAAVWASNNPEVFWVCQDRARPARS